MKKDKDFATLAIHAGEEEGKAKNALNNPIYMTSTFCFDDLEHAEKTFSFEKDDYVYTRGNNPSLRVLEKKMAVLEEGVDSVAFSSGMAAISSVLLSVAGPGDKVLAHKILYGSTHNFIKNIMPENNIETELIDFTDLKEVETKMNEQISALYFETPANPNLDIIDIEKISEIAKKYGAKIVVDNTFATPFFQKPLKLGADVVVHSATKYISGHGDTVAGIAIANDKDYIHKLKFDYMAEYGGVLSPFNAWLLLRGLKTLSLRMKEHEKNAHKIAEFLNINSKVSRVYYPGIKENKDFVIAKKQMEGFGAIISFELKGNIERTKKFVNSLELFKLAVSLGDTESLIEYPFAMTHRGYSEDELKKIGLSKKLLRISVGLENKDDIIDDLKQAFNNI